jgi:hypothetical protein
MSKSGMWQHIMSQAKPQEVKPPKELKVPHKWHLEVPLSESFTVGGKSKGTLSCTILAFTKGEARATVKKKFNLNRLPVGTNIEELGRGS